MQKKEHQNSGTLGKDTINNWIIPFLSVGKRGFKSNEDSSINLPFSVSGNTLTVESVRGQEKTIIKYRKITQAQLDAILATVNNGGN